MTKSKELIAAKKRIFAKCAIIVTENKLFIKVILQ